MALPSIKHVYKVSIKQSGMEKESKSYREGEKVMFSTEIQSELLSQRGRGNGSKSHSAIAALSSAMKGKDKQIGSELFS